MSVPWGDVIASLVPDDPMDTSPCLRGHFAALQLRTLGCNLAIAGALCRAWEEGVHWEESWSWPTKGWRPNIKGEVCE